MSAQHKMRRNMHTCADKLIQCGAIDLDRALKKQYIPIDLILSEFPTSGGKKHEFVRSIDFNSVLLGYEILIQYEPHRRNKPLQRALECGQTTLSKILALKNVEGKPYVTLGGLIDTGTITQQQAIQYINELAITHRTKALLVGLKLIASQQITETEYDKLIFMKQKDLSSRIAKLVKVANPNAYFALREEKRAYLYYHLINYFNDGVYYESKLMDRQLAFLDKIANLNGNPEIQSNEFSKSTVNLNELINFQNEYGSKFRYKTLLHAHAVTEKEVFQHFEQLAHLGQELALVKILVLVASGDVKHYEKFFTGREMLRITEDLEAVKKRTTADMGLYENYVLAILLCRMSKRDGIDKVKFLQHASDAVRESFEEASVEHIIDLIREDDFHTVRDTLLDEYAKAAKIKPKKKRGKWNNIFRILGGVPLAAGNSLAQGGISFLFLSILMPHAAGLIMAAVAAAFIAAVSFCIYGGSTIDKFGQLGGFFDGLNFDLFCCKVKLSYYNFRLNNKKFQKIGKGVGMLGALMGGLSNCIMTFVSVFALALWIASIAAFPPSFVLSLAIFGGTCGFFASLLKTGPRIHHFFNKAGKAFDYWDKTKEKLRRTPVDAKIKVAIVLTIFTGLTSALISFFMTNRFFILNAATDWFSHFNSFADIPSPSFNTIVSSAKLLVGNIVAALSTFVASSSLYGADLLKKFKQPNLSIRKVIYTSENASRLEKVFHYAGAVIAFAALFVFVLSIFIGTDNTLHHIDPNQFVDALAAILPVISFFFAHLTLTIRDFVSSFASLGRDMFISVKNFRLFKESAEKSPRPSKTVVYPFIPSMMKRSASSADQLMNLEHDSYTEYSDASWSPGTFVARPSTRLEGSRLGLRRVSGQDASIANFCRSRTPSPETLGRALSSSGRRSRSPMPPHRHTPSPAPPRSQTPYPVKPSGGSFIQTRRSQTPPPSLDELQPPARESLGLFGPLLKAVSLPKNGMRQPIPQSHQDMGEQGAMQALEDKAGQGEKGDIPMRNMSP